MTVTTPAPSTTSTAPSSDCTSEPGEHDLELFMMGLPELSAEGVSPARQDIQCAPRDGAAGAGDAQPVRPEGRPRPSRALRRHVRRKVSLPDHSARSGCGSGTWIKSQGELELGVRRHSLFACSPVMRTSRSMARHGRPQGRAASDPATWPGDSQRSDPQGRLSDVYDRCDRSTGRDDDPQRCHDQAVGQPAYC